tara:strand:+ start:2202 stop:3038 length:837 start_codon:yes stop_codon:yes gene_type:complete
MVTSRNLDFIAEIGINHNGSIDLAKKHIEEAKSSGATTVKFQTYFTETRTQLNSPIYDILKSCELLPEDFYEIQNFCKELRIKFCSTPFCTKSAQVLYDLNCENIKIASFHLNNHILINDVFHNEKIKNIIISTGVSRFQDIIDLNNLYEKVNLKNKPNLIFLHCISKYPVKELQDYHLTNISYIRNITRKEVGFSDHTLGSKAASISVSLGANYIEKHFTIDNSIEGADHAMSANPKTFKEMVNSCKDTLLMMGDKRGESPFDCEKDIIQYVVKTKV